MAKRGGWGGTEKRQNGGKAESQASGTARMVVGWRGGGTHALCVRACVYARVSAVLFVFLVGIPFLGVCICGHSDLSSVTASRSLPASSVALLLL